MAAFIEEFISPGEIKIHVKHRGLNHLKAFSAMIRTNW